MKLNKKGLIQSTFHVTPDEYRLIRKAHSIAGNRPTYDRWLLRWCGKIVVNYCKRLVYENTKKT
ncbi:hypothetical protein LCGC14_0421040 [marine sediment metagenome]|uniref:Uncharacterized protein n=1 Tax=marine sediment metagenome TaxID=412755 RepID=A0A0F9T8U2_9ZZZZ